MLTFRQAQVAALTAVGANIKEIAGVLGLAESTIKTYRKQLAKIGKRNNIDCFGMPLDRNSRNVALSKIARNVMLKYKFMEAA